ncbi:TonB-dependent receptor [Sphingobium phenoxybenzoativorans]|uniref:TonB-dependent receptor n=1 Tax=Sphingobium phenoxybenzoativorans TaxID=1592790 RepID=A0A975KBE9_9SPHN|nr:TonB-dependent receptor [Sphingobium phenoxybenzoativorans]QUT07819.1 TonB-dependent receptor [Sphingobium phenoxybenzoativorans]
MLRKFLTSSAILTVSMLGATAVNAQQTGSAPQDAAADQGSKIEDIVVTAQRQTSSVQQTPLAITAVGGDMLKDRGIADLDALTRSIPNVNFSRLGGDARIFIRGIGLEGVDAGADGRVAVYTDDVVNARPQAALTSLFDINRIEVLRGPQGTLYGRNATAGAVNIISNDPTDTLDGYAAITAGNYNLIRTEGAISGPLSDTVSARFAFQTNDRDGFGKNITTGNDVDSERSRAARAKLRFEPSETFHLTLTGDYRWEKDNAGGYAFVRNNPFFPDVATVNGFAHPASRRDRAGIDQRFYMENYGLSANATLEIADHVDLTSVTGYRHVNQAGTSTGDDADPSTTTLDVANKADQFSQELRLSLKRGPVDLVVGGFYFHEKNSFRLNLGASGLLFGGNLQPIYQGFGQGGTQKTNAYAAFAQATLHVTDALGIDIGARYSYEKRAIDRYNQLDFVNIYQPTTPLVVGCVAPPITGFIPGTTSCSATGPSSASWSSFDPKATVHYQVADGVMAYATYSRGFKSGGFDFTQLSPAYNPEKLTNYEAGIKADLFDRSVRVNLSGFYYDYSNLQITILNLQPPTPGPVTLNAAKARLYGAEAEITAVPVDDLRMSFNLAWLKSEYRELFDTNLFTGQLTNLAGNQLTSAPKYKVVSEIGYTFHPDFADITPRAELSWTSKLQFSQFNFDFVSQPSRWELNLYLDVVRKGDWTISAYGRNVTNKLYYVSQVVAAPFSGAPILGMPAAPATYGLSVTKHF